MWKATGGWRGTLCGRSSRCYSKRAAKPLTIYVIDESPVDATAALVVAPCGESVLIDTGFTRNLDRVLATLKMANSVLQVFLCVSAPLRFNFRTVNLPEATN